jgi:hypothetical protein
MKKEFVVGISLLCIITLITSSLDPIVVKASDDTHIIEVTSQVYGVERFRDTTVHLTGQRYQNLRHYLITIQARLNQTTTREAALTLFKEAITELDTYGLLPKGMTVDQALRIVSGERTRLISQNLLKTKHAIHHTNSNISSNVINLFCSFYAHTYLTFEDNIWAFLAQFLCSFDLKIFGLLGSLLYEYSQVKPFRFMNRVWVAGPGVGGYTYYYFTVGLLGLHIGSDDFGAAFGFSGIKLILGGQEAIYFGFTLLATK